MLQLMLLMEITLAIVAANIGRLEVSPDINMIYKKVSHGTLSTTRGIGTYLIPFSDEPESRVQPYPPFRKFPGPPEIRHLKKENSVKNSTEISEKLKKSTNSNHSTHKKGTKKLKKKNRTTSTQKTNGTKEKKRVRYTPFFRFSTPCPTTCVIIIRPEDECLQLKFRSSGLSDKETSTSSISKYLLEENTSASELGKLDNRKKLIGHIEMSKKKLTDYDCSIPKVAQKARSNNGIIKLGDFNQIIFTNNVTPKSLYKSNKPKFERLNTAEKLKSRSLSEAIPKQQIIYNQIYKKLLRDTNRAVPGLVLLAFKLPNSQMAHSMIHNQCLILKKDHDSVPTTSDGSCANGCCNQIYDVGPLGEFGSVNSIYSCSKNENSQLTESSRNTIAKKTEDNKVRSQNLYSSNPLVTENWLYKYPSTLKPKERIYSNSIKKKTFQKPSFPASTCLLQSALNIFHTRSPISLLKKKLPNQSTMRSKHFPGSIKISDTQINMTKTFKLVTSKRTSETTLPALTTQMNLKLKHNWVHAVNEFNQIWKEDDTAQSDVSKQKNKNLLDTFLSTPRTNLSSTRFNPFSPLVDILAETINQTLGIDKESQINAFNTNKSALAKETPRECIGNLETLDLKETKFPKYSLECETEKQHAVGLIYFSSPNPLDNKPELPVNSLNHMNNFNYEVPSLVYRGTKSQNSPDKIVSTTPKAFLEIPFGELSSHVNNKRKELMKPCISLTSVKPNVYSLNSISHLTKKGNPFIPLVTVFHEVITQKSKNSDK